jgi:adenosylcobinamide kinase/adenosylcobinamide-phosphate guanylyltransferase
MSLVVLTGPVRSGKSAAAESLATARGSRVTLAVAGWDGDEEMERRIEAHRAARPDGWDVRLVGPEASWVADVPPDAVLVLDCLGTLVGTIAHEAAGEAEVASADAERDSQWRCDALVDALLEREGDTVVVTNEAGWGVVPSSASGRLFRDLLGRANRALIAAAEAAYLVVGGRLLDLSHLPAEAAWPTGE